MQCHCICTFYLHSLSLSLSLSQVCKHPFFWDSQKRLEFLVNISDRLEQESVISSVVLFLESKAHLIIGQGGWDSRGKTLAIDPSLLSDMNKYRKYDTHCVRDLLRVIRNKKHHFHELSPQLRKNLKLDLPTGFLAYFENRFPRLLLRAVEVACTFFSEEKDFSSLCKLIAPIFRGGASSSQSHEGENSVSVSNSGNGSVSQSVPLHTTLHTTSMQSTTFTSTTSLPPPLPLPLHSTWDGISSPLSLSHSNSNSLHTVLPVVPSSSSTSFSASFSTSFTTYNGESEV